MHWTRFGLLFACLQAAFASSGDRSPEFIRCVSLCTDSGCPQPFPLSLQITRWTCLDDCRYSCTHQITDMDIQKGDPVQQFFGKWPFWRFAGMQEPASVAFSLFNLWAHANGARQIQRTLPDSHPLKHYYLTWAFASMNAWAWSAVFHTRDIPMTEKLDYFSAALTIVYAFYYTIIRLFHLYAPPQSRLHVSNDKRLAKTALSVFFISLYLAHVSYLSLRPRFDYTYNMVFNLTIGVLHNVLWLLYALPSSMSVLQRFPSRPRSYRPRSVDKPVYCIVITMLATSLEVFDFPPVMGIIDAHALWHLATAPLAVYWYGFLLDDALDPSWRDCRL